MKYILLQSLLLTGYIYQGSNKAQLDKSIEICNSHNGLYSTTSYFDGKFLVECGDRYKEWVRG